MVEIRSHYHAYALLSHSQLRCDPFLQEDSHLVRTAPVRVGCRQNDVTPVALSQTAERSLSAHVASLGQNVLALAVCMNVDS